MVNMTVRILTTLRRVNTCTGSTLKIKEVHTSCISYVDQNWRRHKKLPANPNTTTILTEEADYTFKDGRVTPYGARQMARINKQQEYAAKMIKLVKEIDHAVAKHAKAQQEEKEQMEKLLSSKLKEKGKLYKSDKH